MIYSALVYSDKGLAKIVSSGKYTPIEINNFIYTQKRGRRDVIFCASSIDPNLCDAISNAVLRVYNEWINSSMPAGGCSGIFVRPCSIWDSAFDVLYPGNFDYVYAYADAHSAISRRTSPGQIFYIGRGVRDRMHQHFAPRPPRDVNPNEKTKIIRIDENIDRLIKAKYRETRSDAGKSLVHKIAQFKGPYQDVQANAVECFLINYWKGVFTLSNLTRGNNVWNEPSAQWLARPKAVSTQSSAWNDAVRQICLGKRITQGQENRLLAEEFINSFSWSSFAANLSQPGRLNPISKNFCTNNTDTHAEFELCDSASKPVFKIQLRLTFSDAKACINIRPLAGKWQQFGTDVESKFGKLAPNFIKHPGPEAYFKPFSNHSKSKAKDVYFSISDMSAPSSVNHSFWMGVSPSSMTLAQALDVLIAIVS